jgi:3-phenylpropionate/trans-cinnamate dioxygenase ferredoxin reductase component
VRPGGSVTGLEQRGEEFILSTSGGQQIVTDCVVAGLGIEPDVGLAKQAGLNVENGIRVDEFCATSRPDIYAAGDVALFFNPALDKYLRVEHEDNALTMGRVAGRNMAGDAKPYHHLPYFYSDMFELGYEAVGDLDARLETVVDWEEPYQKGVIYYLKQGRVKGVLLWNVWEQVEAARSLVAARQELQSADLIGRLPAPKIPVGAGQK